MRLEGAVREAEAAASALEALSPDALVESPQRRRSTPSRLASRRSAPPRARSPRTATRTRSTTVPDRSRGTRRGAREGASVRARRGASNTRARHGCAATPRGGAFANAAASSGWPCDFDQSALARFEWALAGDETVDVENALRRSFAACAASRRRGGGGGDRVRLLVARARPRGGRVRRPSPIAQPVLGGRGAGLAGGGEPAPAVPPGRNRSDCETKRKRKRKREPPRRPVEAGAPVRVRGAVDRQTRAARARDARVPGRVRRGAARDVRAGSAPRVGPVRGNRRGGGGGGGGRVPPRVRGGGGGGVELGARRCLFRLDAFENERRERRLGFA